MMYDIGWPMRTQTQFLGKCVKLHITNGTTEISNQFPS